MRTDHPSIADRPSSATGRSYAIVSTYPPTPCGVATFSAALSGGLQVGGAAVAVVRLGDGGPGPGSPAAVRTLRDVDVVIVQHEYGIYDGVDGAAVVGLLERLVRPSILVAHTVLAAPSANQRAVLEAAADAADSVVVMTEAGRARLELGYAVDPDKVTVIPHGAAVAPAAGGSPLGWGPGPMLTWGLLGPGKGIEHAIDALALLRDVLPRPRYVIAGDTHPKVAALHGEAYREMLGRRAAELGVRAQIDFDPGYRGLPALAELLRGSAVVVLPYDSPDQVTSGVLVDAVAAGRPVVATAFPHAVELLGSGAGLVVPQRDPVALASALRRVLTEPELAESMAAEARRLAPDLAWPAIAGRYAELGERLQLEAEALPA
jgi:glycosyltransferase involved in cell wall biosynthesis